VACDCMAVSQQCCGMSVHDGAAAVLWVRDGATAVLWHVVVVVVVVVVALSQQ
jgi:hypothetical protein